MWDLYWLTCQTWRLRQHKYSNLWQRALKCKRIYPMSCTCIIIMSVHALHEKNILKLYSEFWFLLLKYFHTSGQSHAAGRDVTFFILTARYLWDIYLKWNHLYRREHARLPSHKMWTSVCLLSDIKRPKEMDSWVKSNYSRLFIRFTYKKLV